MFGCDLAGTLKSHLRVEAGKPGANQNFWSRVSVERMACQITEDGLACSSDYGIVMTLASGSTTGSSEPLDACPCRKDMRPTCRIQAAKGSSAIFNSLTFHGHYQEIVGSYACLLMWRKLPHPLSAGDHPCAIFVHKIIAVLGQVSALCSAWYWKHTWVAETHAK